jgi:cell division protein FtsZ
MGGGTGTGAAPVIAKISREMCILTVGIVTMPFDFEGWKRMKMAEDGVAEFTKYADSLVTVPQNCILEAMGDSPDVHGCFNAIDDVLANIVCDITGIFNQPGLVNVDFDEVRGFLVGNEYAAAGLATATGIDRARIAAENAVTSPLLNGFDLSRATGVLVNITAAKSHLKMREINEAMNVIKAASAEDANIFFGAIYGNQVDQELRVTIVATIDLALKDDPEPPDGGVSFSLQLRKVA